MAGISSDQPLIWVPPPESNQDFVLTAVTNGTVMFAADPSQTLPTMTLAMNQATIQDLVGVAIAKATLAAREANIVKSLRDQGVAWTAIAEALGRTEQWVMGEYGEMHN